jgi:AcrR family transcriptional regulator
MATEKKGTEIRKEQIAQAALSLVAGQGLRALTVGQVAKLVGLVPSAIYRHFKNKDEIIDAMLDLFEKRLMKNLAEVTTEKVDPLETLRRLLMRHLQLVMEYQVVPRIMFSEEVFTGRPGFKDRLFRIFKGFLKGVTEVIRRGQEEKIIRADLPAEALSLMFVGLFQPSAIFWHLSHGQFDMVRQVTMAWQVFADSIDIRKQGGGSEVHHGKQT